MFYCKHCNSYFKNVTEMVVVKYKLRNTYSVNKCCKECKKIYMKGFREEKAEEIKKQTAKYRSENLEKLRIIKSNHYHNNKEKYKKYKSENPEIVIKSRKSYVEKHSDYLKRYSKTISCIGKNLKRRSKAISKKVNISLEFFIEWFELQFDENMNWDNYGTYWEIDHVIPVSDFDIFDDIIVSKLNDWKNLRPLEITKNKQKKANVSFDTVLIHEKKVYHFENIIKISGRKLPERSRITTLLDIYNARDNLQPSS